MAKQRTFQIKSDEETWQKVKALADREQRSVSDVGLRLLVLALRTLGAKRLIEAKV